MNEPKIRIPLQTHLNGTFQVFDGNVTVIIGNDHVKARSGQALLLKLTGDVLEVHIILSPEAVG
jgi:hypothetical protein